MEPVERGLWMNYRGGWRLWTALVSIRGSFLARYSTDGFVSAG